MPFASARVGFGLAVFLGASIAIAAPTSPATTKKAATPDTCPDPFSCGAMSARLAGKEGDYPGAFRAIRRGCDLEKRSPKKGDALFACEQYAQLLVSAGRGRGGDPAEGMAMLEQMCKDRPATTDTSVSPCSSLSRYYRRPPKASGLSPRLDKALAIESAACDHGDALACSVLGDLLLQGGPGVSPDAAKARAAFEKGCAGSGSHAAGVCGALGEKVAEGKLGGAPDRKAARPFLTKSCDGGYRCDLLIEHLLLEHRDDEAVRVLDKPTSFFGGRRGEVAHRLCREGHKTMCGR